MRKIATWTFLIIYLHASAQLLAPWVIDGLAHAFFWQDHLEHVHHGIVHSHHVGTEMAEQANDSHEHSPIGHVPSVDLNALSAHLVPITTVPPSVPTRNTVLLNTWWSFYHQNIFIDIFLPPPERAM
jgi:hypothetical protein